MANILKFFIHLSLFLQSQFGLKINYKSNFKDYLITSEWPNYKNLTKFNKNQKI